MIRKPPAILVACLAVAIGCAAPQQPAARSFGQAIVPPSNGPVVIGFDPSSQGYPGSVGQIVYQSGGAGAWVKTGVNATDWTTFPGGAVGSVSVTAPVTGNGTSGSPISVPAATTSAAGLMSAPDKAMLTRVAAFVSPLIDLTQVQTVSFPGSTLPGFVFTKTSVALVTVVKTGTISTSPTYSVGNDGSMVDLVPSNTPATTNFSLIGAVPAWGNVSAISVPISVADLATPISVNVTAGATGTGGFSWKVYVAVMGVLVPSS